MKKYINIEIDDLNNKVNFKYDGIFELHELYKTLVFMIEKIEKDQNNPFEDILASLSAYHYLQNKKR